MGFRSSYNTATKSARIRKSEKRKEKSREAARYRRSQEVETFNGKSTPNIQQPHLSVGQGFHHEADHHFSQSAVLTGQQ
jgi:hypothetical protein